MCGPTKAPTVVQRDPIAEAKAAEATATQDSNSDLAQRRRQRAQNSLLTRGAAGTATLLNTRYAALQLPKQSRSPGGGGGSGGSGGGTDPNDPRLRNTLGG